MIINEQNTFAPTLIAKQPVYHNIKVIIFNNGATLHISDTCVISHACNTSNVPTITLAVFIYIYHFFIDL